MPRLPALNVDSNLTGEAKEALDQLIDVRGGRVSGPMTQLLHVPELAKRAARVSDYIRDEATLPYAARELAIIVAAREIDGDFVWRAHSEQARKAGVSEAAIQAVANFGPLDGLPADEALVIRFSRELWSDHKVSQATFDAVKDRYGADGLLTLIANGGYYLFVCGIAIATELEPRAGVAGLPPRK